jgi:hypothetical protein
MPTLQSSPMYPVIWADQAYRMNRNGHGPLKAIPIPSLNEWGVQSSPHSERKKEADEKVRNQLRTNALKESGMLGHRNTTARSQRYERPASRSAVPNGVFHGSPMDYVTSAGLRGGVITSKEGRIWLAKRLKNRIVEYDAIASGDFSQGPPPAIDVNPKFSSLDSLFQQVFDVFASGLFTSGLVDLMSKLQSAYLDAAPTFTTNQVGPYAEYIQKLVETIRPYESDQETTFRFLGERAAEEENKRSVDFARRTLNNMVKITEEIARTAFMNVPQRQKIFSELRSKLLTSSVRGFTPRFVSPAIRRNIEAVPGVELGAETQPPLRPAEPPISEAQEEAEMYDEFGNLEPQIRRPVGSGRRRRF